jgi:hypothetical protein
MCCFWMKICLKNKDENLSKKFLSEMKFCKMWKILYYFIIPTFPAHVLVLYVSTISFVLTKWVSCRCMYWLGLDRPIYSA